MKKTYRQNRMSETTVRSVEKSEGMTIETMVALFMNNQTDIEQKTTAIYTERKDGVLAGYDIRSDKFDIAIEAMDKASKSSIMKRESRMNVVKDEDGKPDSTQGTENV